ncbi:MAG TPA: hypothetical protein VK448_02175 [Dissulfurispiraceae bacterium]|nr:hypothetical protein [Dissulfurispiraceae bacterium]
MKYRKSRTVSAMQALSIILVIASIFCIVWLRGSVTTLEYKLSSLEHAKMEALRDQKSLVAQRAGLMTLARAERTDLAGMGFSFPERKKVVYVKSGDFKGAYKASYTK